MRATHVLLGIATLWGIWAGSHWLLAGPDELQPTLPRPVNDVESVPIQRNLATKATVKPPSVKAPPKATPRPATTAVSVPKACKICDEKMDPPVPPTLNASTSLICQGFWHRRFPGKGPDEMWCVGCPRSRSPMLGVSISLTMFLHSDVKIRPHCLKDGLEERKELRKTLCSLCKEGAAAAKSPPKTTPKAGILFSIGRHHLHLVSASIKYLRKSLKWTGPIEVYCDNDGCKSDCTEALEGQSVDCEVLKQKFVVRYTSKLLAVLQTRLDYVLMLDADNFLIRSPAEVFDDPAFKRGVSFGWPDLWGSACQNYQWSVTDDNPRGVMLAGQSSWRDHVLWPILDLPWKPEWAYSVELTSSIFAVNKRTPYAVQAWKLAAWMTERPFWAKVLYGDKDTIRLSFLLLGVPFELVSICKLLRRQPTLTLARVTAG